MPSSSFPTQLQGYCEAFRPSLLPGIFFFPPLFLFCRDFFLQNVFYFFSGSISTLQRVIFISQNVCYFSLGLFFILEAVFYQFLGYFLSLKMSSKSILGQFLNLIGLFFYLTKCLQLLRQF